MIRPAVVVFRDILFREECDTAVFSAQRKVPMSPVLPVADKIIAMIPPVQIDMLNRRVANQSRGRI